MTEKMKCLLGRTFYIKNTNEHEISYKTFIPISKTKRTKKKREKKKKEKKQTNKTQ